MFYRVRPIVMLSQAPMFSMSDRSENHRYRHSALTSLPMYAVYANLTSAHNASFERVTLKLKDGVTRE